ncbi:LRP1 [Mytilus coruscus]|uniref:LRP1 n=1 Tax=Mytilus coruscus TaxID=42192 RepID=A0A6J8D6D2_MYTCO|nr:LRP1 [Mytilus coruscus]
MGQAGIINIAVNASMIPCATEPFCFYEAKYYRKLKIWLYYSTNGTKKSIRRLKFDNSENDTVKNVQSELVTGISIDRLYWMEFNSGFLKSSTLNGSSVRTVINTNTKNKNQDINVYGGNVYCANDNSILNVTFTLEVSADVIHNDTEIIYGVFIYDENHEKSTYT